MRLLCPAPAVGVAGLPPPRPPDSPGRSPHPRCPVQCEFCLCSVANSRPVLPGVASGLSTGLLTERSAVRFPVRAHFLFFNCIFPLPFSPRTPPTPCNHHTIVHVHESFVFFALFHGHFLPTQLCATLFPVCPTLILAVPGDPNFGSSFTEVHAVAFR